MKSLLLINIITLSYLIINNCGAETKSIISLVYDDILILILFYVAAKL